jgi:hypothetical protein
VIKTSLTWLESGAGRRVSGTPGYARGLPLLIGNEYEVNAPNEDGVVQASKFINFDLNGFPLRGADNEGKCYFAKKGTTASSEGIL